jgi:Alpha-N-acetylglucosaminidase (NAGLU) tim-barrel domain/Alpha-N-acetylglucosaminidase (NAGLU) C-terminal domain/Alpha-N-acetylglucosaminidase (NAGLU) N-terminal domain
MSGAVDTGRGHRSWEPTVTELSRRAVLGAAAVLGTGTALGTGAPAVAAAREDGAGTGTGTTDTGTTDTGPTGTGTAAPFDPAPAREALTRLFGARAAEQFHLVPLAAGGADRFRVSGPAGRIEVRGTSPATLLTGAHWYLKYVCGASVTWCGERTALPARLPAVGAPIERTASVANRFALNDTNDGYTAAYGGWAHWERLIDVLALHGCNEVLVIAGQEAVYHRTLQEFGYSDAEARAWIPAPSHQPWWLLQNLSGYGGPIGPELLAERTELGTRIVGRLRELGMAPVLPGWFGTVPDGFTDRNPGGRVIPQGTWHGFRRPDWLDPRTDVFQDVGAAFYRHQAGLFGAAGHYKMDLLHEGGTPGDVPVPDAARGVERALRAAHPDAVWVILGWEDNPRGDLLDAVDTSRMLVVDGISDRYSAEPDRESDWGGTPYAFGTIPNYGGRTTIGAKTHVWVDRFFRWRDKAGSALTGTAYLPEATLRDPAAFELFSELAWHDTPVDLAAWFAAYPRLRYGRRDRHAAAAWDALRLTAYQHTAPERSDAHDSLFAARPALTADSAAEYAPHAATSDPAVFDRALAGLLLAGAATRGSSAYAYDLVDVARQAVANRSRHLLPQLRSAHDGGDLDTFRALSALWLDLMRLADDIAGTDRAFLLGPWLEDARRTATSEAEAAELERTARALLTVWGGRATSDAGNLHEYANRDWSGLIADFYLPRWKKYLDEVDSALAEGRAPAAIDWFAFEEPWTRERTVYPTSPAGDPFRTAVRVRDTLAAAPYQGRLTVTAQPAALAPGGTARVTAALTYVNGLAPTGRVDFALTGVDAAPDGPVSLPRVAPGGTGSAHWTVTAPAGPLDRPLTPLPYRLTAWYGPLGRDRVRAVRPGTLYAAGPLAPDLRTVTNNGAVFGQLGDLGDPGVRFGIEGAGNDLWKATAQFGAVYLPGALEDGAGVTTRVDGQAVTGPWARAGIVVRDSLATAGATGFLDLAVTPANGVVLSYDANGDGQLETYRRITGITAPVTLRLTRAGASYTGECSTDDGATWRTVATVTVPGSAGAQDAGVFMSAANGGNGARGLVEFTGLRIA